MLAPITHTLPLPPLICPLPLPLPSPLTPPLHPPLPPLLSPLSFIPPPSPPPLPSPLLLSMRSIAIGLLSPSTDSFHSLVCTSFSHFPGHLDHSFTLLDNQSGSLNQIFLGTNLTTFTPICIRMYICGKVITFSPLYITPSPPSPLRIYNVGKVITTLEKS